MKCEVRLYMEGRKLCSPNFTISVLPDAVSDAQIQSLTEVNTLTGLINEATALIEDVNEDLKSGAFVPELEIGIVETLPTGANATASITGTGKKPVLNLGLPRGPIGTADGLVVDAVLSKDSTNPIQNRAVAEEFETVRAEQQEYAQGVAEAFAIVGENLENKVEKATGKGLSTNDFTTEEKEKLEGIEAGANKFALEDGAVTRAKLASDALYSPWRQISSDTHDITKDDIGIKLREASVDGSGCHYSLSYANSHGLIPVGAEFSIFKYGGSEPSVLDFVNMRVVFEGGTTIYGGINKTVRVRISTKYKTIAFDKLYDSDVYGDTWRLIGVDEVEVVA